MKIAMEKTKNSAKSKKDLPFQLESCYKWKMKAMCKACGSMHQYWKRSKELPHWRCTDTCQENQWELLNAERKWWDINGIPEPKN